MRANEPITYCTTETALGAALVAATPRGVCDIAFADTIDALVHDLDSRCPAVQRRPLDAESPADVRRWLSTVSDALQSGETEAPRMLGEPPEVPLDLGGTAFQQAIWTQLRQVPRGQVVTYSDLARAIGAPRSVRAVGSACGANRLALLIPCHRAVRQDGQLGGFRWGLDRKARVLAWERTGL